VKWFKRLFFGVIAIVGLVILVFAAIIIFDGLFGVTSTDLTNVTYTGEDGVVLHGYLAEPEGAGPHPAVLLIHEWWGLNEGMTILADALAAEGYTVLAVDAYRGELTTQIPRALWLLMTTPEAQIFADVDAGLDYLLGLDNVDAERVATMGFCFGGGQSLQLGMRESQNLALTIMYYGAVVTEPDLLRPLTDAQPVLGIFAGEDATIAVEDVIEFEAALNSLDIENQITIYDGVGHGFVNEENYNQPGQAGDAWQETLDFLSANFKE
jgi:carboxymethylenebutenolidase